MTTPVIIRGNQTQEQRFWSKVRKGTACECWLWLGKVSKDGYGRFKVEDRNPQLPHRVSWELTRGPIPDDQYVMHSCSAKECVNPDHLYLSSSHMKAVPLETRFWPRVDKMAENGCWEWTGMRDTKGYGRVLVDGRPELTHRIAWLLVRGCTGSLLVCHRCDNPPCVNPDHMFLGTHKDNTQDMLRKGRMPSGEANKNASITNEQAREIRTRAQAGESLASIARALDIKIGVVSHLWHGRSWRSIK